MLYSVLGSVCVSSLGWGGRSQVCQHCPPPPSSVPSPTCTTPFPPSPSMNTSPDRAVFIKRYPAFETWAAANPPPVRPSLPPAPAFVKGADAATPAAASAADLLSIDSVVAASDPSGRVKTGPVAPATLLPAPMRGPPAGETVTAVVRRKKGQGPGAAGNSHSNELS